MDQTVQIHLLPVILEGQLTQLFQLLTFQHIPTLIRLQTTDIAIQQIKYIFIVPMLMAALMADKEITEQLALLILG